MKKALLGLTGALLATSAFTGAANAVVISTNGTVAGAYTAANAIRVAAEYLTPGGGTFIGDAVAADTAFTAAFASVIGGGPAVANFAIRTNITGAAFRTPTTVTATPLLNGAPLAGADGSCSTFLSSASQLVFTCTVAATKTVNGIRIDAAAAGDTPFVSTAATLAGTNIQLDFKVSPDTNFLTDSEAPAPATTVIAVVDGALASFTANTTRTIAQTPVAPGTVDFNSLNSSLGPASATSLATTGYRLNNPAGVTAVVTPALLAVAIADLQAAASSGVVVINSGLIGEAAVTAVTIAGGVATRTKTGSPTSFSGTTATITLTNAEIDALIATGAAQEIQLTLSGTAALPNTVAGTGSIDVQTGAPFTGDEAIVNGAVAAATRGGFLAHFNNFYTLTSAYESFIRIVNPTGSAGTANLRIWDAGTGALVCTATTPSIVAQSTLEANRATIVTLCGAQLPATLPTFLNAEVSGQFNGYAQHVVWNNRATVTDLSGRRL